MLIYYLIIFSTFAHLLRSEMRMEPLPFNSFTTTKWAPEWRMRKGVRNSLEMPLAKNPAYNVLETSIISLKYPDHEHKFGEFVRHFCALLYIVISALIYAF